MALMTVSQIATNVWLSVWSDESEERAGSVSYYLGIYVSKSNELLYCFS